jgi:hypothetical protein
MSTVSCIIMKTNNCYTAIHVMYLVWGGGGVVGRGVAGRGVFFHIPHTEQYVKEKFHRS